MTTGDSQHCSGWNVAMPKSIPKGLNREHVLKALDDFDAGIEHPFGKATKGSRRSDVGRRFRRRPLGHVIFHRGQVRASQSALSKCS